MRIIGHGIDLVRIVRVRKLLGGDRDAFLDGWFHDDERETAPDAPEDAEFYAGRVAVKEAVAKALGTGFAGDISWTDVRVTTNERGAVQVELVEGARSEAEAQGIKEWFVSLSHTEKHAVASAIAVGNDR